MILRLVVTDDLAARLQALAEAQGVAVEEPGLRAIALGLDILSRQPSDLIDLGARSSAAVKPQSAPDSSPKSALGGRDAPDN